MTILDRWLRRTDDARRTKGDPPPTYAQLTAQLREAKAMAADFLQQCANLRHQVDGLIVENARLRSRVHRELSLDVPHSRFPRWWFEWTCPIEGHTKVAWRGNVAYCPCGRTSADVDHSAVIAPELGVDTTESNSGGQGLDPDPSRGYIADWEAKYAETGQVPAENSVWLAELRIPDLSEEERAAFVEAVEADGPVPEAGKDETR